MRHVLHRCLSLVAALVVAATASAQQGALTIPRNLDQLTASAALIVRGRVVSAVVEKHPELTALDTVVVTLRVADVLKGESAGTYTFRQYVWHYRDRLSGAGYRKGQDLLLLMNPESRYGLTSPVALGQGRFVVTRDAAGREIAVNGNGNALLFSGIEAEAARRGVAVSAATRATMAKHPMGPIPVTELSMMIRELGAAER